VILDCFILDCFHACPARQAAETAILQGQRRICNVLFIPAIHDFRIGAGAQSGGGVFGRLPRDRRERRTRCLTSISGGIYDAVLLALISQVFYFSHNFISKERASALWLIHPRLQKSQRKSGTTEE
jgi:hypothetical protein